MIRPISLSVPKKNRVSSAWHYPRVCVCLCLWILADLPSENIGNEKISCEIRCWIRLRSYSGFE